MTNAFCDDSQPANVDYSIHFNDMKLCERDSTFIAEKQLMLFDFGTMYHGFLFLDVR